MHADGTPGQDELKLRQHLLDKLVPVDCFASDEQSGALHASAIAAVLGLRMPPAALELAAAAGEEAMCWFDPGIATHEAEAAIQSVQRGESTPLHSCLH